MPGLIDLHCGRLDPGWAQLVPELTALAAEYAERERAALQQAADGYAMAPSLAAGDQPRLMKKGPPRTVRVVGICSHPKRLGVGERPRRRTVVLDGGESITTQVRTGERIWLLTPSGYAEVIAQVSDDVTGIGLSCGVFETNPTNAGLTHDAAVATPPASP